MNPTQTQNQNSPLYTPAGGVGTVDQGFTYTGEGPNGGWEQNLEDTSNNISTTSAVNSDQARDEITGITTDVANTETQENQPVNQRDSITSELSAMGDTQEQAYNDYVDALDKWSGSAIKFSRDERKQLDAIKDKFKSISNRQIVANQGLEGSLASSQATSGIARYGSELAAMETNQIVQHGIDRLREIDLQAEEELRKTREAIIAGHVDGIKASYESYNSVLKSRRDTLSELRLNLNAIDDQQNDQARIELERRRVAVAEGRLSFDTSADGGSSSFTGGIELPDEFANMPTEQVQKDLRKSTAPDWFTKMLLIQLANSDFEGDSEISAGKELVDTTGFVGRKAGRVAKGKKSIDQIKLSQKRLQDAWNNFKETPEMKKYTAGGGGGFLGSPASEQDDYSDVFQ